MYEDYQGLCIDLTIFHILSQGFRWQNTLPLRNTLPLTTESLTRNVELIKTINRLKHGGFYSKSAEVELRII